MFHDSMAIAQEKMTKVCIFLEHHALPPSPLNYNVVYTYISQVNTELNSTIDRALALGQTIDCVYIEQLYFDYMDKAHQAETSMVRNVDGIISSLSRSANSTEKDIMRFANHVSDCVHSLDENNIQQSRTALNTLSKHTAHLLTQHQQFKQELIKAKRLQEKTQQQLV